MGVAQGGSLFTSSGILRDRPEWGLGGPLESFLATNAMNIAACTLSLLAQRAFFPPLLRADIPVPRT